jgi:hypothetical protein
VKANSFQLLLGTITNYEEENTFLNLQISEPVSMLEAHLNNIKKLVGPTYVQKNTSHLYYKH